jgi:SAM-dependent methyltransferase
MTGSMDHFKKKKIIKFLKKVLKNVLPFYFAKKMKLVPSTQENMNAFIQIFNKKQELLSDNRFSCSLNDILPCLNDNTSNSTFDSHYIYHTAWASRILNKTMPIEHIDIGSSLFFVSIVSAFIPIKFYDYRPARINLSHLNCEFANITSLPFSDGSIDSISCMHVVEHIGLERYGDPFDPQGDLKAIRELQRVTSPSGTLLFVVPIAEEMKIQYNAHRIYTFKYICDCFHSFHLENFAFITDDGQFFPYANENNTIKQKYGCGCFWFKKREV